MARHSGSSSSAPSHATVRATFAARAALRATFLALLPSATTGLENGVGQRPPMGYSTWNDLGCKGVTADAIKGIADTLVAKGLDKLGYRYLNVDDCWVKGRDDQGALVPDPAAFPEGMQAVVDYAHGHGLKFGLYTDRGVWTCGARPGSAGYERLDVQQLAGWGVDYLKVDSCNAPKEPQKAIEEYMKLRDFLNATSRHVFLALCGWAPWYAEVGRALGNSWRVAHDLNGFRELWNTVAINSKLARFAGPGAWNDPDGLVGSTEGARVQLMQHQSRTQFGLWAIMSAPLILGTRLSAMSDFDLETYTNEEVIAIDQDDLGKQGYILWENCPRQSMEALVEQAKEYPEPPACQQLWGRPLLGGDWAVAMVNWAEESASVVINSKEMEHMGFSAGAHFRDLWRKTDLGLQQGGFRMNVAGAGGSELFRLRGRHFFA